MIGELNYNLKKDQTSKVSSAIPASNSTRFELCNSLAQANQIIQSENRLINSQNNFNEPSANSTRNPIQVTSASKIKDDLYSHNQFNFHHSNIITQKLPNIEYFNYLENQRYSSNKLGVSQNGVNVSMSGLIDLTKDSTFVRNGELHSSKIQTKISNFNF